MDANESDGGGTRLPEIRIRKSSDAPSLGDVKQHSPAPLASFEALSDVDDSDTERAAEDSHGDVFQGYNAALTNNGVDESLSLEGLGFKGYNTTNSEGLNESECQDTGQTGIQSEDPQVEETSTLENSPVTETPSPPSISMDNSELTTLTSAAENSNGELLGRDLARSPPPPRPPPPTPQFDRSACDSEQGEKSDVQDSGLNNGDTAENFYANIENEYMALNKGVNESLGQSEIVESLGSEANDEYMEINYEKPILETEKPEESTYEKITIKLPGRSKSPKKQPKPPTESWTGFDQDVEGDSVVTKSKPPPARPPPPSRPPPPKVAPPRPAPPKKNWETFDGSSQKNKAVKKDDKTQGEVSEDGGSFDGEDDQSSLTEKKSKSRSITPKKLKGFVTGKKEKKEKKDKDKQKDIGEFKKFTSDGKAPDKDSEQWQAFQAMLDRSKSAAVVSQQKITKMETQFDKKLGEKLANTDPWMMGLSSDQASTAAGENNPDSTNTTNGTDWVGFDDNFGTASTLEPTPKLTALSVSPVPSPRHDPVPPNNSRRQSIEGKEVGDLLGMSATESHTSDLLGLDTENSEPTNSSASVLMHPDIMALSRNTQDDSTKSSECSSPARDLGLDPFAAMPDGKDDNDEEQLTGAAISIVDDFLGISGQELKKPEDPLQALLNKSKKPPTPEEPPQDAVGGFLGMTSRIEDTITDDDPFGLGSQSVGDVNQDVSSGINMDLFIVEDGDPIPGTTIPEPTVIPAEPEIIPPEPEPLPKEDEVFVVPINIIAPRPPSVTEDVFTVPKEMLTSEPTVTAEKQVITPSNDDFDFDPRAEHIVVSSDIKPAQDMAPSESRARPRPRARPSAAAANPTNPFNLELVTHDTRPISLGIDEAGASSAIEMSSNPFASAMSSSAKNPFTQEPPPAASGASLIAFADDEDEDTGLETLGSNITAAQAVSGSFNPFATISDPEQQTHVEDNEAADSATDSFDPFQTIHGDDAFEVQFPSTNQAEEGKSSDEAISPGRINPFDKEPPLDEKFASFEPKVKPESEDKESPKGTPSQSSTEEEEDLEPIDPFHPAFEAEGWKVLIRQPTKKKLAQNRFWKQVFVKIVHINKVPIIKVYANEQCKEQIHELPLQPSYNLCNMGLQTFDQFGKCHTIKIQYVFYRERVGVKAERIAPTLSDLTRVRDFKGLKDLVHRPKATMILDHAPQASELLKFGGLDYNEFKSFIRELENTMFKLEARRDKTLTYTKDEITVDVVDEYYACIDKDGHTQYHKARVRVYCLAFLTGMPCVEVGLNDKRRRGKEVVGRHDIIPIKTEEWIRIEEPEFYHGVDPEEFTKNKVIKYKPLDACQYELMRFRIRPQMNKELPLQIRAQMSVIDLHVEIRADIMIPGYYSNSRRSQQTPCEDIMVRFPIPEPWIYLFRVEKRFRYGSVKSTHRKPGKIKGLERLTMMAQGMLPPSLIEVSSGSAKYEHIFHSVIWRINRLPERNEGAYKTHLFVLKLDLGPHDVVPEDFDRYCYAEYNMPNSTMSRAQIRSISVSPVEENPDKWVHHLAKYEYKVEMDFSDKPPKPPVPAGTLNENTIETSAKEEMGEDLEGGEVPPAPADDQDSTDSSDSDSD